MQLVLYIMITAELCKTTQGVLHACTINVLRNNSPVCNVNVEEDTIYHIYSDKGESC
ncbi:MAG: hypothetical protein SO369_07290 [Treponema sp.]|nr:hypothetical protein [Treponema sp.]